MPPGMERSPDLVWSGRYSLLAKEVLHLSHLEEGSEPLLWRSKPRGPGWGLLCLSSPFTPETKLTVLLDSLVLITL